MVPLSLSGLVLFSLLFSAPLEGIADPTHTPNPAKAPWYFLGLQELLHYFPPVVAGVLVPSLLIIALIVIPYFNINIEANGLVTATTKGTIDNVEVSLEADQRRLQGMMNTLLMKGESEIAKLTKFLTQFFFMLNHNPTNVGFKLYYLSFVNFC